MLVDVLCFMCMCCIVHAYVVVVFGLVVIVLSMLFVMRVVACVSVVLLCC